MILKCPRCGKKMDTKDNPFRPFCSERCKLVDLGSWLSGSYRIPESDAPDEQNSVPDDQEDSDIE
jgi:endogenous inhibitor of DNA gyrase (YacG/DUF329 family)